MKEEKHNTSNKIESMVRPGGMQAQVKYRTEAHAGVRQDFLIKSSACNEDGFPQFCLRNRPHGPCYVPYHVSS